MTPETRAARDRITAYLDRRTPELHDRIAYSGPGRDFVALFASDLRTVLAALDRYEAWDEAVRQDIREVAAEAGFAPGPDREIKVTYTTPAKVYLVLRDVLPRIYGTYADLRDATSRINELRAEGITGVVVGIMSVIPPADPAEPQTSDD